MSYLASPHARMLLADILTKITLELSPEDAHRWADKIHTAIEQTSDFPERCPTVPLNCFIFPPENYDNLHQLIVNPYRIVYEVLGGRVCVLSIRHSRQMLKMSDTFWNDEPTE